MKILRDKNPLEQTGNNASSATLGMILQILAGKIPDNELYSLTRFARAMVIMLENSKSFLNQIIESLNDLNQLVQNNQNATDEEKSLVMSSVEYSIEQLTT